MIRLPIALRRKLAIFRQRGEQAHARRWYRRRDRAFRLHDNIAMQMLRAHIGERHAPHVHLDR